MSAPMTITTRSHSAQTTPGRVYGSFVLNGASAPTVVGGAVQSVRRLETAAPASTIFFRVTFDTRYRFDDAHTVITTSAQASDQAQDLTCMLADLTADPADTKVEFQELDIMVKDGGTAVDTAGIRVHIDCALTV